MFRLASLSLLIVTPVFSEERTFSVTIDGKAAGDVVVSIQSGKDGLTLATRTEIKSGTYSLSYQAKEKWKDGRLVRLEGSGAEGGKKGSITLITGKDGYLLKAATKEVTVRGEVWPGTYWIRSEADSLLLVDVMSGEVVRMKVEKVGPDRRSVDGKPTPTTRFKVTAGGTIEDLWYDGENRLVRRTWTKNGRTFAIELIRIAK